MLLKHEIGNDPAACHAQTRGVNADSVGLMGETVIVEYDISEQIFESSIVVQETDLDVFGHVNNAAYLRLFENARWDIIHGAGITLPDIVAKQVGPVILGVEVKFAKELRARDPIVIRTQARSYRKFIGTMFQEMVSKSGIVHCSALFTFGIFDTKARKLIAPPQDWQRALGLTPRA